jgi:hypothetical protein
MYVYDIWQSQHKMLCQLLPLNRKLHISKRKWLQQMSRILQRPITIGCTLVRRYLWFSLTYVSPMKRIWSHRVRSIITQYFLLYVAAHLSHQQGEPSARETTHANSDKSVRSINIIHVYTITQYNICIYTYRPTYTFVYEHLLYFLNPCI